MASPKTERVKRQVYKLLESGPVTLYELCSRLDDPTELLTGALQSMWAKGDILLDTAREKELPAGEEVIIRTAGGDTGQDRVPDGQFVAIKVAAARSRLRQEVRGKIEEILADGIPRHEGEIAELISLHGIKPESVPGVIVLPDGRYTLRSVEAGRAELERRKEEAARNAEKVRRQKKLLDDLLKDGRAVSENELQEALDEPLAPEVARSLVLLTGGKYALPDSPAALEDIAAYISRREPVGQKAFAKMFKAHKKLVAAIRKGNEKPPFVILPDGRVTVEHHPAGQKELQRREMQFEIRRKLAGLVREHAFFSLAEFTGRQKKAAAEEAVAEGCTWVEYEGKTFWCSPLKFPPRKMAGELAALTGIKFPPNGKPKTPVVYLMENSLKPAEVARELSIRANQVVNLYQSGYLPGFNLEGSLRIWIPPLQSIQPGTGLERALRRIEEIGLLDAARVLGVPREMVYKLVREGHLAPVQRPGAGRPWGQVFRRGDVEDLLGVVSRLKEKWEAERDRKFKRTGGKRRPHRYEKETPRVPEGPITLDRFQVEAIRALEDGQSVLVAAPTGTGKTLIAEKVVEKVLGEGREVIYTSPIKALSNQKFRDFSKLYGREKVGLITGDVSINERAPLLVMTTEIFRNWCFSNPEWMADISFVIFDEVHYLDDPHRGTAWEESIIFAPPHIKILGLSATVPNIHELAAWMSGVRQYPVTVVKETERAVPLVIKWVTSGGEVLNEREAMEAIDPDPGDEEEIFWEKYNI